jgi:hypothetical protein
VASLAFSISGGLPFGTSFQSSIALSDGRICCCPAAGCPS